MERAMTDRGFRALFGQFLNGYWGAFHEVVEAQSVKPERLATSLVENLIEQHHQFVFAGLPSAVKERLDALGRLWQQVQEHREFVPDAPLSAEQVHGALREFQAMYDVLVLLGKDFPATRADVLAHAVHADPRAPLRADAAP